MEEPLEEEDLDAPPENMLGSMESMEIAFASTPQYDISYEELQKHFDKPLAQVARIFNVCTTFFKVNSPRAFSPDLMDGSYRKCAVTMESNGGPSARSHTFPPGPGR